MTTPRASSLAGALGMRGFTLLEVVVALVVLELSIAAAAGLLVLSSATLSQAEQLGRSVALAEGILDSLVATSAPIQGSAGYAGGELRWCVDEAGEVLLWSVGSRGDTLFEVRSVQRPPVRAP